MIVFNIEPVPLAKKVTENVFSKMSLCDTHSVFTHKQLECKGKQLVTKAALLLHPLIHWQQPHFCGVTVGKWI